MSKTIVIIEDNEKNMKLFVDILNTLPELEILSETSGDRGLELIKNSNADLIILDIQLPVINGIEICQELRKLDEFKNVPIVALTAFAMKGDKRRILEAGFSHYISKPVRAMEFRKKIHEILA